MKTISELVEYVESLHGTVVRGKVVLDTDIRLQGDYSGTIKMKIGIGLDVMDRIMDDGETTELVWHFDDVRDITAADARWEYWDEFDDRMKGD